MHLSRSFKKGLILLSISAALVSLSSCNKKTNREIILIPEGYTGFISVIHGVEEGGREVLEEGKTIINVGNNGIGMTRKHHWDNIAIENEFYYVNAAGKRTKIAEITAKNEYKGGAAIMNTFFTSSTVTKPDGSFAAGSNVEGSIQTAQYVLFVNDTSIYNDGSETALQLQHDSIKDKVIEGCTALKRE